jgi:hypothetical protein
MSLLQTIFRCGTQNDILDFGKTLSQSATYWLLKYFKDVASIITMKKWKNDHEKWTVKEQEGGIFVES